MRRRTYTLAIAGGSSKSYMALAWLSSAAMYSIHVCSAVGLAVAMREDLRVLRCACARLGRLGCDGAIVISRGAIDLA